MNIPMSGPDITDLERQAVLAVLETDYLSIGPQVEQFERAFAELTGNRYAVACNSGTSGLHMAMEAVNVKPNTLVITTPFSFVASSNCILYQGAIPIFVDIEPQTYNIDPSEVAQALADLQQAGERAARWFPPALRNEARRRRFPLSALLSVDVFGQPADADALQKLATEYGIPLVEDACEALGSSYKGRPTGSLGDLAVFGFYPNKQITTGEGGMVVTNDESSAALCRSLRNQGRDVFDAWLGHTRLGYNYRISEMSAALGLVQLQRLPEIMAKRCQVANWYTEQLADMIGVTLLQVAATTSQMSWFVYVIRLDATYDRDEVIRQLQQRGVPSRPYFPPIHLQPFYRQRFGYHEGIYPLTEAVGASTLALPFSSKLSKTQVDYVCEMLRKVLAQCGAN